MLLDLELKFLETTGYIYNIENLFNALNITRRWDIILRSEIKKQYEMREAIEAFQNNFAITLLLAPEILDFSYEKYLEDKMRENECESVEDYLTFYEENGFIEDEIRFNVSC